MKRITFVLGCINKLGGTEKATIDLANLFVNNGYNVSIISIYSRIAKEKNNYHIDSRIKVNFVYKKLFFLKYHLSIYRMIDYFSKKKINRLVNETKPDFTFYTSIKSIPFTEKVFSKILMVHNNYKYYTSGRLTKRLLNKYHNKIDKIIFLSHKDFMEYENEYHSKNGDYVYNISSITPRIRTNYKNHNIIYMGRIENSAKQLNQAVEIIGSLVQENLFNDWKFQIFGNGPDKKKIEEQIRANQLDNYVKLRGTTSNIEDELARADIMILTSDFEGLPMSLIEAAACGLPLISYDSSAGIHAIIKDHYNGYIVTKNDRTEFTNKLSILLQNEELRRKYGSNSVKRVSDTFSSEVIFKKWNSILDLLSKD